MFIAYTMRYFCMTNGQSYFLPGEETSKARAIRVAILLGIWHTAPPNNALCTWEQVFQKLVLVSKININVAITKTRRTSRLVDTVDAISGVSRIGMGLKLGIAVHRLSGGSFHNDMDWTALFWGNQACLTTEKLEYFLFRN